MGVFRYLIFFKLIIYIDAIKSKSVNLALETVLEFNNKDKVNDVKFLNNVQQFIDKIKSAMDTSKTARRFDSETRNIKFTDFLKSAIDTLKAYDDDDLEDVFAVLDDEIRKYHYRGCKFYELVEDRKIRRFVANKLDRIKQKPAQKLRKNLDYAIQAIENSKFSGKQTEFLDYVNSIYGKGSSDKFIVFLNNLQTYSSKSKRSNLNLIKVVRDGLRSVIFDHYSALNPNARRDLKIKLESNWRNIRYPERLEHEVWTVKYTNFNGNKHGKNNAHTKEEKHKLTTDSVKLKHHTERSVSFESSDVDKIQTSPHYTYSSSFEKHKNIKDVYFISKKTGHAKHKKGSTTSLVELKLSNSEGSLSIEAESSELVSAEDKITTSNYKPRQRPKKQRDGNEKISRVSKVNNLVPNKARHVHKKVSSFITLYPAELSFNTEKTLKLKSSTRTPRIYTLWEEKIRSKTDPVMDKHRVIADSDTIINVERAVDSSEEDIFTEKIHHQPNSETKSTKHQIWRRTETAETKYKPTTHKKFRKHMPKATAPEAGISIESSGVNRRSLIENNINEIPPQIELKRNVLKRINNLEKQMEEVKSKIDTTKQTTENTLKITEFEPSELWTSSTASTTTQNSYYTMTNNNSTIIASTVQILSTESSTIDNVTQLETKTNAERRSNSNERTNTEYPDIINIGTNKEEEENTDTQIDIVTNKKEEMTTDSVNLNVNQSFPQEMKDNVLMNFADDRANDGGVDLDKDIDQIMKKYSINTKPVSVDPSNRFIATPEISGGKTKADEVEDIIERDMKKLLSQKSKDPNELSDTFQDLNMDLDLMKY